MGGRLSLYSFSRIPLIIPLSYAPPKFVNCTSPPSVTIFTLYGHNQCILSFLVCWMDLLSYINTKSPSFKVFILICLSCQYFSLYFYTFWWNPSRIWSSSMIINWFILSCTMPHYVMCVIIAMCRLGTKNSNGTTDSCRYTNMNGVCPVNFLHVVVYSHNTAGTLRSQSSLLTLQIFVSAFSRILLNASTALFSCGWYGVLFWWWTSNSSVINLMVLLMKWVHWSLIKIIWKLNLVITSSNRKCAVVSALQYLTSVTSAHLGRYLVTVIMYLSPVLFAGGLIGPKKYVVHFLNTYKVTHGHSDISSLLFGLPTLWQTLHL